jgi:hypothetical protein
MATLNALPASTLPPEVINLIGSEQQAGIVTMVEQVEVTEPLGLELGAAVPDSSETGKDDEEEQLATVATEQTDSSLGSNSEYNSLGQCK